MGIPTSTAPGTASHWPLLMFALAMGFCGFLAPTLLGDDPRWGAS